jgi:TPR repeat protein
MRTPTPWLYGLAVVVVLNIVAWLFISPAMCMFRLPLMLAAYVIGTVLFFKLGVWPALALWWGIGLVVGLLQWSYDFRSARHSKDADVKPPSLVTVVRGLFAWPVVVPLQLLAAFGWVVVNGLGSLCYFLYKKLLPKHVPHYGGIEECKKAAISGDAQAQLTLGNAYANGEYGLPQDYAEAAKWYRKAAEQDHHTAQLNLGVSLVKGQGVEQNVVEGYMWVILARRGGGPGSGHMVIDVAHQKLIEYKAHMTEQQIAEAWVMAEAISSDVGAQWTLGGFYARGEFGLPQDYAEAAKWYRKAAEQNYALAQLDLGVSLAKGQGVEQNVVEGCMWVILASRGGGPGPVIDAADQKLIELKAHMTEQQIAEACVMAKSRSDRSTTNPT